MYQPLQILLVDDDAEDQEIFVSVMERVLPSATCSSAGSSRIALEMLRTKQFTPDVIFLDLNMPIMSGQQFLVEIKKHPDIDRIPVIILSTSSNPSTIAETRRLGALHFITKPDRFSEWEQALRQLFSEQLFLNKKA